MPDSAHRVVLSIAEATGAAVMDAGNILALNLVSPEGTGVTLVVPYAVAEAMGDHIGVGLDLAADARELWAGLRISDNRP